MANGKKRVGGRYRDRIDVRGGDGLRGGAKKAGTEAGLPKVAARVFCCPAGGDEARPGWCS